VEKFGAPANPIILEPMSKFPLVRDLFVNRQRLFKRLKKTKCWVPIDGTYDLGPGPPIPQELRTSATRSRAASVAAAASRPARSTRPPINSSALP